MVYYVVKYDVNSFQGDKPYEDDSTVAPEFIGPFDTIEEANAKMDELSNEACDTIDVQLVNGKQYQGPQYIYRVCEGT
ncbi:MAG: hypothetical protein MJZ25_03725 [Fibrobacter sp.]|nr:hypothetical protein [Fibrobacter sp.]